MSRNSPQPRLPVPHWVGPLLLIGLGAFLAVTGRVAYAALLIVIALASAGVNTVYARRGRRLWQAASTRVADSDMNVNHQRPPEYSLASSSSSRWRGAGMIPGSLGYMTATWPLAALEVSGGQISFKVRPRILAKVIGSPNLTAGPGDRILIEPVRSHGSWPGIKFTVPGRPSYYFWTNNRPEVIAGIEAAGFEVSEREGTIDR